MKGRFLTIVASTVVTAAMSGSASADVSDDQDVQAGIDLAREWLNTQLNYDRVPGASIAVVSDQELVWSEGFGYARLRGKVEATPDTRYSICSVSKLFTSIGVMQLRDEGKLSLDAPLDQLLPWYELPPHENAEEAVTLRNILSHVAGLPREAVTPYWTEVDFPDRETLQSGVVEQQALYRPYERFQYSNLGMSLAGEAIIAASGERFDDYMQAQVLNPLELSSTTSELPVKLYGKSFAAGYALPGNNGKRKEVGKYTLNAVAPAAGFASSANDLAKFASWQFRLLDNGGEEVLKATTLREMQRLQWAEPDMDGPNWGLGFALSKIDGKVWVGHGGYCPGYRTAFLLRPQDKLAVAMMVNVNDVSPGNMARQVISLVTPSIIATSKADADDDAESEAAEDVQDLSPYAGVYGRPNRPERFMFVATSKGLKGINPFAVKPAENPLDLRHEDGDVFRVHNKKDEALYTVSFDRNEDQEAARFWMHGQYYDRLK